MAHEELMRTLPAGMERVFESGPCVIRDNGGVYSVVVLNPVLVTCGGKDSKARAAKLAQDINAVWKKHMQSEF